MAWFPNWPHTPIPGVSLSASGLLALADLSTIAQRTAITGGSSWLDSLLLAPGLHYQQAVEDLLARDGNGAGNNSHDAAVEISDDSNSVQDGNEELATMSTRRIRIPLRNSATAMYIRRIVNTRAGAARPGETITLDVGAAPSSLSSWGKGVLSRKKIKVKMRRSDSGMHTVVWTTEKKGNGKADDDEEDGEDGEDEEDGGVLDLGWVSHLLYLASPVLTVIALVFVVLLRDWWALAQLLGLMLSRILNIWVIKQRTKRHHNNQHPAAGLPSPRPGDPYPHPISTTTTAAPSRVATPKPDFSTFPPSLRYTESHTGPKSSSSKEGITSYIISLTHPNEDTPGTNKNPTSIRLRGKPSDLEAITSSTWLRSKTHVEGYLEAMAKLVVYGVAAFSGNTSQTGAIIMMGLLLITAGLLALSNSRARSFCVNGRVVVDASSCLGGRKRKKGVKVEVDRIGIGIDKKGGGQSVLEGEPVALGSENKGGQKEEFGRGSNNAWSSLSSPGTGGQLGLGLYDGMDNAADRAEKGEIRHSPGSLTPSVG